MRKMADEATPEATSSTETGPARFTAEKLIIEPLVEQLCGPFAFVTKNGRNVRVSIDVLNTGDEPGMFTAALILDGEVVSWWDVKFRAAEWKRLSFRLGNVPKGDHWVSLAGFTGTFASSEMVNWGRVAVAGLAGLCLTCVAAKRLHECCRR
jgi:hypothetical protein